MNTPWADITSSFSRGGEYRESLTSLDSRVDELEKLSKVITDESAKLRLVRANLLVAIGDYHKARNEFLSLWTYANNRYGPNAAISLEATLGNAKCLEKLRNHAGAAFNYKRYLHHIVLSGFARPTEMIEIQKHLAWNYEQAGHTRAAHSEYRTLLRKMKDSNYSTAVISSIEYRAACCEYGSDASTALA